jgi:hypothetical protein
MWGVVWLDAPESTTQSVIDGGGVSVIVLKELSRECWSHSPVHGVQDGGCGGGARGRGRGQRCRQRPHLLHRRAVVECSKEGGLLWRRPGWVATHGWVGPHGDGAGPWSYSRQPTPPQPQLPPLPLPSPTPPEGGRGRARVRLIP